MSEVAHVVVVDADIVLAVGVDEVDEILDVAVGVDVAALVTAVIVFVIVEVVVLVAIATFAIDELVLRVVEVSVNHLLMTGVASLEDAIVAVV